MAEYVHEAARASRHAAFPRWLLLLLIGGVVGYALPLVIPSDSAFQQALADGPALLLGCLWILPLLIIVHEGGHLVAAWLVEFSFHYCIVGPLKIIRTRQGVRVRLSKEHLLSGAVLCYPLDDRRLRLRLAIVSAAGPLANFALAAVAWRLWSFYSVVCCTYFTRPPWTVDSLAVLALLSLETGVANLIPFPTQRGASDGLHIFRVLSGGRAGEREVLAHQMARYILGGARPREWPGALVLRQVALAETPQQVHGASIVAYSWALDTGDSAGAGMFLDRALATIPTPSKPHPALALEAAYFAARYRSNLPLARAWLAYGKGTQFEPVMRPRAEMAMLLVEGRCEEALMRATQGLAACELLAPKTMSGLQTEAEDLRAMAAEAHARSAWASAQQAII